jgi:hypothetical protein
MIFMIFTNHFFIFQFFKNDLINLFINECKTLFIRIRKPTPQLILALARKCATHLNITTINASDAKKKGRNWFSTWRTRLYDDCLMIAFDFMDRYEYVYYIIYIISHVILFIFNNIFIVQNYFNLFDYYLFTDALLINYPMKHICKSLSQMMIYFMCLSLN